jgi:Tol biopolymer transport system component
MSERWQQIVRIYQDAMDLPVEERAAFLDQACAGDDVLRRDLEALIAANDRMGDFLEAPLDDLATEVLANRLAQPQFGQTLGRYKLQSLLGAGGMGEVYCAHDLRLDRDVAVKILPEHLAKDPQSLRRFEREAKAVAALSHPNILAIYDFGADHGVHYAVTELLEGETLRDRLTRGPLGWREAVEITIALSEGLAAAHAKGIIHRDLKPGNIFLTSAGQVKILDFGIARVKHKVSVEAETLTATAFDTTKPGVVMGTIGYMSPEQLRGEIADAPSDIFSLGCVLFEMSSGRRPFIGSTVSEVMAAILRDDPPQLADLGVAVPMELERIVRRCLEKKSEARYQSAPHLLSDLKAVLSGNPLSAAVRLPVGRRGRRIVWLGAVAAGLLVALTAGFFLIAVRKSLVASRRADDQTLSKPDVAFQKMRMTSLAVNGYARLAAVSPDGRYIAYVIEDGARQSLWVRQVATASSQQIIPLAEFQYRALTFSPDGNFIYFSARESSSDFAALFRAPVLGGEARKLLARVGNPISFSPDGKQFAFIRPVNLGIELTVADADGANERRLASIQTQSDYRAAWSPDSKLIVFDVLKADSGGRQFKQLIAFPVAGGAETALGDKRWFWVEGLAWLSSGDGLIVMAQELEGAGSQLWRISYPEGEAHNITNDLNDYFSLSLTADSRTIVAVQTSRRSNIWSLPNGDDRRAKQLTFGASKDGYRGVAWTPDGKILYDSFASGNRDIWAVGREGGEPVQLTTDSHLDLAPSVSSDGRHIVFISSRSGSYEVWRMSPDGSNQKQLSRVNKAWWPFCTIDGDWVLYVSSVADDGRLWKVPVGGGESLPLTDQPIAAPSLSPDGNLIACFYYDSQGGRLGILPSSGGEFIKSFSPKLDTSLNPNPQWTPDGKSLTYVDARAGVSNIWSLPLAGGTPKQLTNFKTGRIYGHAWSRDGKSLACARGALTSDVVIIKDSR